MTAWAMAAAAACWKAGVDEQRGVGRVAHVAALDEHLGHRRQVQAGQVVARLQAVDPVVGADRHGRAGHEGVAQGGREGGRRARRRRRSGPSATGSSTVKPRPPGGPPSAWMSTATSACGALMMAARVVTHGPTPALSGRVSTTVAPSASQVGLQVGAPRRS